MLTDWKFQIISLPCQTPRARCAQHLEPVVYSSSLSCRKEIFGLQSGLAAAKQSWWQCVGKCSCANGSSTWSRGRAQQKVAQLFLWTIHPPGQTLEKPMAGHQPPIITGPLIKVHHFWLLILHSYFDVGRSAVGTAVMDDIWESSVPDHKKIGSAQQYWESYTCKAVKS